MGWVGTCAALGGLWLAAWAVPAAAQSADDCRCVDADGNAIADCTCFRAPSFDAAMPWVIRRPMLGINVSTSQGNELDAQGAAVANVLEDGPAWNAGIREGDVITSLDGQSLFEPLPGDREDGFDIDQSVPVQRLLAIAADLEPGDEVEVSFLRDGDERTATLTAEDLSSKGFGYAPFDAGRLRDQLRSLEPPMAPNVRLRDLTDRMTVVRGEPDGFFFDGSWNGSRRYGLELVEMNTGLGRYFGTDQGVLVASVSEGSTLGLQAGDVILRIGERDAQSADRVQRILASYGDEEQIPIHIRRDGREMSVMGRLSG
jgi:C-terminal processing protease CtpA/Prc